MVENGVTRWDAPYVEGAGGLAMPQVGVWGFSPKKLFENRSCEKGILGQFQRPQEKRLKKKWFFLQKLGKKVFA